MILNHAPPLLRHRVLRDGVLLYACSEVGACALYTARREYLDFEPRLREQTRLLVRHEGGTAAP